MSLAASTPVRVVFFLLAVAVLPACASSGPAAPDLDPRLLGVWADLDDLTGIFDAVEPGFASLSAIDLGLRQRDSLRAA